MEWILRRRRRCRRRRRRRRRRENDLILLNDPDSVELIPFSSPLAKSSGRVVRTTQSQRSFQLVVEWVIWLCICGSTAIKFIHSRKFFRILISSIMQEFHVRGFLTGYTYMDSIQFSLIMINIFSFK